MSDPKPDRILVVEDDKSLLELVRFRLRSEGYEVLLASNGRDGIELARRESPDLILLDLMMPEMDGYEVLRELRSSYRTRYIPVIVVTARTQNSDRLRGLESGANDYVSKPYVFAELMLRVRNLLNWTREHRDMNPLTGLPGNICIEHETSRRMDRGEHFGLLYVDINNFKAFNDYYGYVRGDAAIRALAGSLGNTLQSMGRESHFLGHVGGDDFVILTDAEVVEDMAETVIREFGLVVPTLYDTEDCSRGFIEVSNRRGESEQYELMTLTVVGISSDHLPITHYAELADRAFELKRQGKSQRQNALVTERRRGGDVAQEKIG